MKAWLESVPKVELHLHLEGAIPAATMWDLMERHGGDPAILTPQDLASFYRFRDFDHFISLWHWKNQFIRDAGDFVSIGAAVAKDLSDQNIVYAEAFFSPSDFAHTGMAADQIATALRSGLEQVPGTEVALIADLVRERPVDEMMRELDQLVDVQQTAGVIGVGLGGNEHRDPPQRVARVWDAAHGHGFQRTAHAGEVAGPANITAALDHLRVERIGHGVRAIEDPKLVRRLVEEQIPLEVCPISNIRTGIYPDITQHPVGDLITQGVLVTLNTDDPAMFGNRLADEYMLVASTFELGEPELLQLLRNSVDGSWAEPATKRLLHEALTTSLP